MCSYRWPGAYEPPRRGAHKLLRWPTLYIETQGDSHMLSVEAFMTGIKMESSDRLRVDQRIKMNYKDEAHADTIKITWLPFCSLNLAN